MKCESERYVCGLCSLYELTLVKFRAVKPFCVSLHSQETQDGYFRFSFSVVLVSKENLENHD